VPTWLETPGECRAPVFRAAPPGAIPSERGLGRDVAYFGLVTATFATLERLSWELS